MSSPVHQVQGYAECWPTAWAMALGLSAQELIAVGLTGERPGTTWADRVESYATFERCAQRVIDHFGLPPLPTAASFAIKFQPAIPEEPAGPSVLCVTSASEAHAVYYQDGMVYDPARLAPQSWGGWWGHNLHRRIVEVHNVPKREA